MAVHDRIPLIGQLHFLFSPVCETCRFPIAKRGALSRLAYMLQTVRPHWRRKCGLSTKSTRTPRFCAKGPSGRAMQSRPCFRPRLRRPAWMHRASEIRTRFEQGEIRRAEGDAAMRHVMRGSCMPEVRRPCQAAPFKGEARAA